MPSNGKLEAEITVPAGGWDITFEEFTPNAGPVTLTVPAGTYYHSSNGDQSATLGGKIKALADADGTLGGVYTVSTDATEGGNGKTTISLTGALFLSITFTDTDLRDCLGFTGNKAGSQVYTSTDQAEGLWLAGNPYLNLDGSGWSGWIESDKQGATNAAGFFFGVQGARRTVADLRWNGENRAKTWAVNEVIVNQSFEQFYLDAILGEGTWGASGGPIRFYPDADVDGTFVTYSVPEMASWKPEQVREGFVHLWRIIIPRVVEVPS